MCRHCASRSKETGLPAPPVKAKTWRDYIGPNRAAKTLEPLFVVTFGKLFAKLSDLSIKLCGQPFPAFPELQQKARR